MYVSILSADTPKDSKEPPPPQSAVDTKIKKVTVGGGESSLPREKFCMDENHPVEKQRHLDRLGHKWMTFGNDTWDQLLLSQIMSFSL